LAPDIEEIHMPVPSVALVPVLAIPACVPGHDGVPDAIIGHLLCGDWAPATPSGLDQVALELWPLLVSGLAAVVLAQLGWRTLRHRSWRAHAAQARWLTIIPPVTATPAATAGLWRLLATLLPAPRWFAVRPHRLVWEVHADPRGMRCGLWLPPGINPTAVTRLLQRAWPGVRTKHTCPPRLGAHWPVVAVALHPTRPDWLPLVEDPNPPSGHRWGQQAPEEDRLRAVYDGLAAAGRTGGGLLQVIVSRAPRHRLAALRKATTHPGQVRRARGAGRIAGLLADGLRAIIIAGLDVLTPGPSTLARAADRRDPNTADLARQARAKLACAPHLLVAVHATATGPTRAAALAAADDITSGFGLLSAHLARRRIRRARASATWRWVPAARMSLASVDETAALAGLPGEPAAYGLPAAASRRRPAARDTFTAAPASSRGQRTPQRPATTPSSLRN
jgi:hypothetical protein